MANVGPMEVVVVLLIALIVFGPKRLPELGRSLGDGIKGFKESLNSDGDASADHEEASPDQPESAGKAD